MRTARRSTWTDCWRSASPPPPSSTAESITAVIAAAGSGERLRAGGPKAFVSLAGRPMIEWSLDAFSRAGVSSVIIACPPGIAERDLQRPGSTGPGPMGAPGVRLLEGGQTRTASVSRALAAVETELVAVHDAARPLVSPALISGVIQTLLDDPGAAGAITAIPVTDTIKRALASPGDPGHRTPTSAGDSDANPAVIEATLERARLWAAQTPQVFRVAALRDALCADPKRISAATDEAMLVEAAGGRVLIHPASPENLKVTTALDLRLAEVLLTERPTA